MVYAQSSNIDYLITFKNALFRNVKKLNSFLNNAAVPSIDLDSGGHVENVGHPLPLKEGMVSSNILAGRG